MHPPPEILHALRSALAHGPALRLALLFGSRARGTECPDSDIDIGIVPRDEDLPLGGELALQASLETASARRVDLVRLDRANVLVRWEAARDGIVLVAEPPAEAIRWRARAAADHADMEPAWRHATALYLRRVAGTAAASP